MKQRLLFAVATLAWACSAQAQTPTLPTMPGYPAVGDKPIVTVISPGANARPLPHPAPAVGLKEHMDITMTMTMGMEIAGMATPTVTPPSITMGMDVALNSVAANGDITMSFAYTGVTVNGPSPDASFDQMTRTLGEQMKTFKGTITIGADGHVVSQDINIPTTPGVSADTAKNIADSLRNMTPPLPQVPMGVGGKWEARLALQTGGVAMFQKMAYEVVAIDGSSVTLKVAVDQTFPAQPVSNPQLPPGAEMAVESGGGSGSGTITLRSDSMVPASDMTLKNTLRFRVSMNGETQPLAVTTEIKVQMKKG